MSGRKIVVGIVVLAAAGVSGATWYRFAARPALARELEAPETRARAFLKLLRMNHLWGLAQDHFYDARTESPGASYLLARGPEGCRWHVVRAAHAGSGSMTAPATILVSEDGTVTACVEGGIPFLLSGGPTDGLAAIVAPVEGAPGSYSVLLVGKRLEEALRTRGAFSVESAGGLIVTAGKAPSGDLPLFRYDAGAGKLRGPEGGPDKPWQVDRDHSTGYVP